MHENFNPYQAWLGLEAGPITPDYYQLLSISPAEEDARRIAMSADAASCRVRSHRPGAYAAQWSQLLDEIAVAKEVLLDFRLRQEYDARRVSGSQGSNTTAPLMSGPPGGQAPWAIPAEPNWPAAPATNEVVPGSPASDSRSAPLGMPTTHNSCSQASTATPAGRSAVPAPFAVPYSNPMASSYPVPPPTPALESPPAPPPLTPPSPAVNRDSVSALDPMRPLDSAGVSQAAVSASNLATGIALGASSSGPAVAAATSTSVQATPNRQLAHRRAKSSITWPVMVGASAMVLLIVALLYSFMGRTEPKDNAAREDRIASVRKPDRSSKSKLVETVSVPRPAGDRLDRSVPTGESGNTLHEKSADPAAPGRDSETVVREEHDSPSVPTSVAGPMGDLPPSRMSGSTLRPNVPAEMLKSAPKAESSQPDAPAVPTPTSAELQSLKKALLTTRDALSEQNFEVAEKELARAKALARLPDHVEMVERLSLLASYARDYQKALATAIGEFNAGDTFKLRGNAEVVVVEATPNAITIRAAGRNKRFSREDMPIVLSLGIADSWLDDSPGSLLVRGAYLLLHKTSDERDRELGRQMWQRASERGIDVTDLFQALKDDYNRLTTTPDSGESG